MIELKKIHRANYCGVDLIFDGFEVFSFMGNCFVELYLKGSRVANLCEKGDYLDSLFSGIKKGA